MKRRRPSPPPPLDECRALLTATLIDPTAQPVDRRTTLIHALRERWPGLTASAALFVVQELER